MTWGGTRQHKYGARSTKCANGHTHASKREARRCAELHLLQRAGQISDLEMEPRYFFTVDGRQVKHDNGRRAVFTPDFRYRRADGRLVIEEVKPPVAKARGRDWPLRKALFRACYPDLEIREV